MFIKAKEIYSIGINKLGVVMNSVDTFQSTEKPILGEVRRAAAAAAHCPVAPEGACPAYMAIRRLSDPQTPLTEKIYSEAITRIHSCPSAQSAPCHALKLIEDSV